MKAILAVVALGVALGCATSDILVLDPSPRAAKLPDSVAVLLEEPRTPYRSIALVEVSDQNMGLSLAKLGNKMKAEAAKLGGDAVIIGTATSAGSAVIVPVGSTVVATPTTERKLVGKVIVYIGSRP